MWQRAVFTAAMRIPHTSYRPDSTRPGAFRSCPPAPLRGYRLIAGNSPSQPSRARVNSWSWPQLLSLPQEEVRVDIHCVTKWSKFDTTWRGVAVDTLLRDVETSAAFVTAHSYGGYTTNLPLADLRDGKAWIVHQYDGRPLTPEHGGPARLLVPHLYFWKSAKWVSGLTLATEDRPGFWEVFGYNNYGDPWREQRYTGD